jgi:hypothetical protein
MRRTLTLAILSLAAAACDGPSASPPPPCDVAHQTGCGAGQYCEVQGSSSACFAPVILRGTVVDPTLAVSAAAVAGARVVALDPSRVPVSSVATTSALGVYELAVHFARDASGRPTSPPVTLRADAQSYQTFPGGVRPALPIDPATASTFVGGRWVIDGPVTSLTAIELFRLEGAGTGRIAGTVTRVTGVAAPLIVAEPQGVTTVDSAAAVAGADGAYVLFNLAPGVPYVVRPYARGVNWAASPPTVPGAPAIVNFAAPSVTSAGVTGGLIFRTGAGHATDVELVIESTYNGTLDRGEVPPGLAGRSAANDYAFSGVPDGHYRVLAAYGADGDVRDQAYVGNATPPTVTVAGGASASASASFATTPAIHLLSIGGNAVGVEPIVAVSTAAPTFVWTNENATNSGTFRVNVFDSFGKTLWGPIDVAGDTSMSITYAGVALTPGRPCQLRITAIKTSDSSIQSQTEDLLGVFTLK